MEKRPPRLGPNAFGQPGVLLEGIFVCFSQAKVSKRNYLYITDVPRVGPVSLPQTWDWDTTTVPWMAYDEMKMRLIATFDEAFFHYFNTNPEIPF
jgi:hypothetical protein